MHDTSTTIVAVATPPGRGGVGCLRVSGERAAEIARRLFVSSRPGRTHDPRGDDSIPDEGPELRFGRFVDRAGRKLDHGFLVLFPPGAAYTGEASAELWCHGSPAVLGELVEAAVAAGAVPAGPGEFTYRALRNGRMDLTRSEAVRDLISARTAYQARIAFSQLEGAVARRLAPLKQGLEEWVVRTEAAVEFVDESETHLPGDELARALEESIRQCETLLRGFDAGRVVREGATVALSGRPNVGKSLLFNRLLARERAIVTETEGTTRDTLEEALDLDGVPVQLVDTAGLRDVLDPVESEGVRRAERAHAESDLVLLVLDGSRPTTPSERALLEQVAEARPGERGARTVVAINKRDLPRVAEFESPAYDARHVSALTGEGVADLARELRRRLVGTGALEDPVLTNRRHALALENARKVLEQAARALEQGLSEELVLEDMKSALEWVGEIGGEFTNEDLYDRIFSTFCIGK